MDSFSQVAARTIANLNHLWDAYRCDHADCDDRFTPDVQRCVECDANYCQECWKTVERHRDQAQRSITTHTKCDPMLNHLLTEILHPPTKTEEQQRELHQKDARNLWFGITESDGSQFIHEGPVYEDLIFENPAVQPWGIYPGLVTFVGETGAGKSALIKLLIDSGVWAEEDYAGPFSKQHSSIFTAQSLQRSSPIVGSVEDDTTPTSADVHLYADPRSLFNHKFGKIAMLYADCEGLDGGDRDPVAVQFAGKCINVEGDGDELNKRIRPYLEGVDGYTPKQITWAEQGRQALVRELYPRLLYSFSDVVVFVLDNPRKFESVLIQLVKWAHQAIEKACNQSVLPHAVVALNRTQSNGQNAEKWESKSTTQALLKAVQSSLTKNDYLRGMVQFWDERKVKIETVDDLLNCYYASTQVIRIPLFRSPVLLEQQITTLYEAIKGKCKTSQQRRQQEHMQLDAVNLHHYLRNAFNHFADHADKPFDFVKASFEINPISANFSLRSGISRLAQIVRTCTGDIGLQVWERISRAIASCILLSAYQRDVIGLGDLEGIFTQYWPYCEDAIQEFNDKHTPCAYTSKKIPRCVNFRNTHRKGHQSEDGSVEGGPWRCSEKDSQMKGSARLHLERAFHDVAKEFPERPKLRSVFDCHRKVISSLYRELGNSGSFKNHVTCLSCLMEAPEHTLPCGHTICTPCITAAGESLGSGFIKIEICPLCDDKWGTTPYLAAVKPAQAGARILTLDGGGIRGIVELTILRRIELELGDKIPIQAFFDLIVGTSTGGIVALGLGHEGWTVTKCTDTFKEMAKDAFTPHRALPGTRTITKVATGTVYSTSIFEETLRGVFSSTMFGDPRKVDWLRTKTAVVTTTPSGPVTLLSNYNREASDGQRYHFFRGADESKEFKAWEGARATSAVPGFWRVYSHEASEQVYLDGGVYHNNPIRIADSEQKLIWPATKYRHPDILLSIGTGFNEELMAPTVPPPANSASGVTALVATIFDLGKDVFKTQLASERAWQDWIDTKMPLEGHVSRYRRINVPLDHEPRMDRVDEIEMYESLTETYLDTKKDDISDIVNQLIASCFYYRFEKKDLRGPTCSGRIECRLPPGDDISRQFGEILLELSQDIKNEGTPGLSFCVTETHVGDINKDDIHQIEEETILEMRKSGKFNMPPFDITISSAAAETNILMVLHVRKRGLIPISGFPRCLLKDYPETYRRKRPQQNRDKDAQLESPFDPRAIIRDLVENLLSLIPEVQASKRRGSVGRELGVSDTDREGFQVLESDDSDAESTPDIEGDTASTHAPPEIASDDVAQSEGNPQPNEEEDLRAEDDTVSTPM